MWKCTDYSLLFCEYSAFAQKYRDLWSFRIDWNRRIRRHNITASVRREVWRLHISGDVVSRCRTRNMYREIHCDEYLRLRLRKSKAIRFNHRERRYETRAMPVSIFSGAYLPPAFSLEIYWLFERQSRFCITLGRDTLSRAGKTEDGNLLFPRRYDVLFMSGGLILGIFKVAAWGLRYAARSYFSYNVVRRIYARQTMIRHAPSSSRRRPVSRRYFRDSTMPHSREPPPILVDSLDPVRNRRFRNCRTSGYLVAISS